MTCQLPKVFVKDEPEDKLKICFNYNLPGCLSHLYIFVRPKQEQLAFTMARMKLKMSETLKYKNKKRKHKNNPSEREPTDDNSDLTITLLRTGKPISANIKNIDAWAEETHLKINDATYEVFLNPPTVSHLSLPKNVMAGFPVYPKLELEFCERDQCDFNWYRSLKRGEKDNLSKSKMTQINQENWLHLSDSFFYLSNESDVGCKLRMTCVPKCGEKTGLEEVAVTKNPVVLGPERCPFEDRHQYTKTLTEFKKIRCVSYNILADLYADSDTARNELFPYCPKEALTLDYRRQLYLKEIIGYNADIICMQEVDRKVFHDDLVPVLSTTGLEGIYSEKGGQVVEGLSCFYRSSKFRLVDTHSIILSEAVSSEPVLQSIYLKLSENEKLKERFMNRTTALQIVVLENLDVPQKRIVVANTHLYFHPDSDNIRLIQAASCVLYLQKCLHDCQTKEPAYHTAVILSGDFNSCPEFGVYRLMTKGSLAKDCIDWQSNPEETVQGIPLAHKLELDSACGTPQYTNYTEGFVGCLDYIFYDKSSFNVGEIVPFPKHEDVTKHTALPNRTFPSDHIALICTLEWK